MAQIQYFAIFILRITSPSNYCIFMSIPYQACCTCDTASQSIIYIIYFKQCTTNSSIFNTSNLPSGYITVHYSLNHEVVTTFKTTSVAIAGKAETCHHSWYVSHIAVHIYPATSLFNASQSFANEILRMKNLWISMQLTKNPQSYIHENLYVFGI